MPVRLSPAAKDPQDFSAAVPDKEERKGIRRERIARAAAARDRDGDRATAAGSRGVVVSKGQQQAVDALAHLDKKKAAGIDAVTAVRVGADERETQRRDSEERKRQERLQRLQEEAVRSGKQNAAIEMRWSELLEQNMPQELHDDVEAQKAACARVVAGKDALVAAFQAQLKAKDEEYIKGLKQQAADVDELLRRVRTETRELRDAYDAELEAVDDAFLQERDEVLATNKAEMDAIFERRRETDLAHMERKQRLQERQHDEIEEMLTRDSEEYSKLKVKLESDMATLEQQLEEMRATYQLNTEKLEYNYRVLTERDAENSATLAHQKRRLTKLKDALSALVQRHAETDARDRRRNDELTEDYRRITRQYKDLQAKFRHFEVADNERHGQIWAMHREDVLTAARRVVQADEVIHAQLLGWSWTPPDMALVVAAADGTTAGVATGTINAVGATGGGGGTMGGAAAATAVAAALTLGGSAGSAAAGSPGNGEPVEPDGAATHQLAGGTDGSTGGGNSGIGLAAIAGPMAAAAGWDAAAATSGSATAAVAAGNGDNGPTFSGARIKAVLTLLAQEAGFLVDKAVREALAALPPADAQLAAAESALAALGVASGRDMEQLISYFFGPEDPEVDYDESLPPRADFAALGLDPAGEPDALRVLLTAIRSDDVVRAIHAFVEDRRGAMLLEGARGGGSGGGSGSGEKGAGSGGGGNGGTAGGSPSPRGRLGDGSSVSAAAGGGGGGSSIGSPGNGQSHHGSTSVGVEAASARRQRERILRRRERESWERLSGVLSQQGELVWERLERSLGSYNGLLAERARRLGAVDNLRRENDELRQRLQRLLGAAVNADLIVPPTLTIKAHAAAAAAAAAAARAY